MSVIRARLAALGLGARVALAVALVVAAGVLASVVAGDAGGQRAAAGLGGLLDEGPGKIVVDREGKPVLGPDGKPLRVASDGKTLLDSRGRPLRDAQGRPIKLGPGNKLPEAKLREVADRRRANGRRVAGQRRARRPGRRRPGGAVADGSPILIGMAHLNADAHNGLGGRLGVTTVIPDPAHGIRALGDYINATGGILGRPVKLDIHEYNPADGRPFAVTMQAVCEHFRKTRPLAVVDRFGNPHLTVPCLSEAGIALVADWPFAGPRSFFARYPDHYYSPGGLAADRMPEPYVRGLRHAGFFERGERVGLLRVGHPILDEAGERIKRELAEARIPLAEEVIVDAGDSAHASNFGRILAELGRAVVRFRAAGVTRVLSTDAGGSYIGLFMRAAEGQGYRPRYGLSSMNAPNWRAIEGPASQLRGAVGVGWAPLVDVPAEGEPPNATRDQCAEAFRRAGAPIGNRSPFAQYAAYGYCDGLLMIRAALERSRSVSVAGLRAGVEALGSSYLSPVALATRLDSSRHDGAAEFRLMRYRARCNCFRYD